MHVNTSNKQHFLIGDININIETHNNVFTTTSSNYIKGVLNPNFRPFSFELNK